MHEILLDHDVFNQMQRLLRNPFPDNVEAEKLDDIITEACESGESTCRRHKRYHWSIDLDNIKRQLSIWYIFRSLRRRELSTLSLTARATEIGVNISANTTQKTVTNNIDNLRKQLKEAHAEAASKREEMLTNLANFEADTDGKQKAKVLRQMKVLERKARVYSLLKHQRKKIKILERSIAWKFLSLGPQCKIMMIR